VRDGEVLTADRHEIHTSMRRRRASIVNGDLMAVSP
jgi:hypothetical protein